MAAYFHIRFIPHGSRASPAGILRSRLAFIFGAFAKMAVF
jgi:hypothetical protein